MWNIFGPFEANNKKWESLEWRTLNTIWMWTTDRYHRKKESITFVFMIRVNDSRVIKQINMIHRRKEKTFPNSRKLH